MDQRWTELAQHWELLKPVVLTADIAMNRVFPLSQAMWLNNVKNDARDWTFAVSGDLISSATFDEYANVFIQGNCKADLILAKGGLVHILGDLSSKVIFGGPAEIVVGGDIGINGQFNAASMCRAFIGGCLDGQLAGLGSLTGVICGSVRGAIATGAPSCHVHVMGDFVGSAHPGGAIPSVLYLVVDGFMPSSTLRAIGDHHSYVEFKASVGKSDWPAGIYPEPVEYVRLTENKLFRCWIVRQ